MLIFNIYCYLCQLGKHWLPKREETHRMAGRIFRANTDNSPLLKGGCP